MKKSDYNNELKNVLNDTNLIIDVISSIYNNKRDITIYDVNEIKNGKTFKEKIRKIVLERISIKTHQG
jgi:hypothetical protein